MTRPSTWMGIPNIGASNKKEELTKIQENVDGITRSLIQFAHTGQFDFPELKSLSKRMFI